MVKGSLSCSHDERLQLRWAVKLHFRGHSEESDTSPVDTALREAEEEIGLPRSSVHVVGQLDDIPNWDNTQACPATESLLLSWGWYGDPFHRFSRRYGFRAANLAA